MITEINKAIAEAWDKITFAVRYPKYVYTNHPYSHFALLKDDKVHYKGKDLHRIVALTDFSDVKKGDLGGYVENRYNLQCHNKKKAWIYDNARVGGGALITENAQVKDNAKVFGPIELKDVVIGENQIVFKPVREVLTNEA